MYQSGFAEAEPSQGEPLPIPVADRSKTSRWGSVVSALVSLALLVMIVQHLRTAEPGQLREMIPSDVGFWLTFAGYYLAGPVSEWIIYRRLWGVPFSAMGALLRKLVSNELLLGYLGEVQFYAWVRSRLAMATTPFGAIKDVTILSALTGNIATIIMLGLSWPLVSSGAFGVEMRTVFISLSVVLLTSFVILLFRQKLFSLPWVQLRFISLVHLARIVAVIVLAALMWHLVLPDVGAELWLILATLRMLISRLPLLPNKDVVFAGLAVFLLGHEVQVGGLMAMMAAILFVAHVVVGASLALGELLATGMKR